MGLKEAAWLWSIEMWPVMRATAIPGSVPSATVKGQPALGQFVAMGWVGGNWESVSKAPASALAGEAHCLARCTSELERA